MRYLLPVLLAALAAAEDRTIRGEVSTPFATSGPGSGAIDAGVPIPNINDLHNGAAPDLGAYELGDPEPQYGPR